MRRVISVAVVVVLSSWACVGDPGTVQGGDGGDAAQPDAGSPDTSVGDASDAAAEAGPPTPTGTVGWAVDFGGPGDDVVGSAPDYAVAFDAKGDVIVVGSFSGTATFGNGKTLTSLGLDDAFVAKYDPSGACVGVARIGGASTQDATTAIAVDPANDDVLVAGKLFYNAGTLSSPFAWSVNAGQDHQTKNGAFLVRFSNDLTQVKYAQDLLPNGSASGVKSIAAGASNVVALGGTVQNGTSIPFGQSTQPASGQGGPSVGFVAEYDGGGNFVFARILSSLSGTAICETFIGGVAFDPNGMLVASGGAGGFDVNKACNYTADYANNQSKPDISQNPSTYALLLLRYDPTKGGTFATATVSSRTSLFGYPQHLAIAPSGDAYATFSNESGAPFTFGSGNVPAANGQDGLVLHYDSNGAEAGFVTIGSAGSDLAEGVAVDAWGNVVVGGYYGGAVSLSNGKSLPAASDAGSGFDAFVVKFDPTLATCLWANAFAGSGDERGGGVATGPGGVIATSGTFDDATFSVGNGKSVSTQGGYDGFAVYMQP